MVLYAVVAGFLGLMIGSAINAYVWRLHEGKSWVHGRSQCSDCGHVLAAKDLVPVLSWLWLRGRCRYCDMRIKDHPVVEVLTALLFGASGYILAPMTGAALALFGMWLVILTLLIVLAVYDARWLFLPNKVMLPLVVVALIYAVTAAVLAHSGQVFLGALEAAAVAGGAFWLLVHGTKGRGMGGGDINLAFAMGLFLGLQAMLVAMFIAFDAGAVVGIWLLVTKRRSRRDHIPFGPYLVAGAIVAFLCGRAIAGWYVGLNGLGQ